MCSAATSKQKKLGPFVKATFASSTDFESTLTGHGASGARNSSKIFLAASFTYKEIFIFYRTSKKFWFNDTHLILWQKFQILNCFPKPEIQDFFIQRFQKKKFNLTLNFLRWILCPKISQTEIEINKLGYLERWIFGDHTCSLPAGSFNSSLKLKPHFLTLFSEISLLKLKQDNKRVKIILITNNFYDYCSVEIILTSFPTIQCCHLSRGLDNPVGLRSSRILDTVQSMRCNWIEEM